MGLLNEGRRGENFFQTQEGGEESLTEREKPKASTASFRAFKGEANSNAEKGERKFEEESLASPLTKRWEGEKREEWGGADPARWF